MVAAPPSPPASPREEVRTAVASAVAAHWSAVDACKDKMFLARQFCLVEACDKPGARMHPMCIRMREEARLREEAKVRN
jgi:serine/threonine-protein kinase